MSEPKVKIIAISNVFCRSMHFEKAGDVELGHCHTYDHGTLVSIGRLLVEMLDENEKTVSSKEFVGPSFVFISKFCKHRLTALEDNTVAVCIHAMRDIDQNILSTDFLIDEKWFADKWEDSNHVDDHYHLYTKLNRGVQTERFSCHPQNRKVENEQASN